MARSMPAECQLIAPDLRGHGDSDWVTPPAYHPLDYAGDLVELVRQTGGRRPVMVGHSMGGLCALAFADRHPEMLAALVLIDIAIVSSHSRDRFLRRLRSLPVVTYPDFETAQRRFRLMPSEGRIDPGVLARIARHSLKPAPGGGYTMKFDRETFFGGDGIETIEVLRRIELPTLLVRGQHSRIMTPEASRLAVESNSRIRVTDIPQAHHHVILEQPAAIAAAVGDFLQLQSRDRAT